MPLSFAPGEAYQFDWSHEIVVLSGVTVTVKVAHVRLCHSRMMFVRAYPRETQEMVFDAHERAFALFKGACTRGIYDNMKTAVETIFIGKDRQYNRRFLQMCATIIWWIQSRTPASGWEKGQVENQVGLVRERFFTPRLRFKTYDELNAWLTDKCIAYAKAHPHPERPEQTVWDVFEEERPKLVADRGRFDGFHALPASGVEDLPGALRQQQILCATPVRCRTACRDPCLCRSDRHPPGRTPRRGTPPQLQPRRDDLRPVALRAGSGPQTGRTAQRRAIQGLGAAGRAGAGATQTRRVRRWRSSDGRHPGCRADRWIAGGRPRRRAGDGRGRPFI